MVYMSPRADQTAGPIGLTFFVDSFLNLKYEICCLVLVFLPHLLFLDPSLENSPIAIKICSYLLSKPSCSLNKLLSKPSCSLNKLLSKTSCSLNKLLSKSSCKCVDSLNGRIANEA